MGTSQLLGARQRRKRPAAAWAALAAAAGLLLGGCSATPPPFGIFDTEAGEQDVLPRWVRLEVGGEEVRYLTSNETARYYVSRSSTDHCLVVVFEDRDESWSAACNGGLGSGLVVESTAPGSHTALVVDGYAERNNIAEEGWQQLHENVLVKAGKSAP
ncbi:hypothetical protein H9639_06280 [Arthrobacter sp. Sa2CUA1]|uniref:Lipoprotein n=1 Tax=Arthrobacter gallicola TaxID=2762225 RepID=A0ABR8UQQ5_9MICC|nr:hypothetical protein [Arthrobacter gallicola]MBD7994902.1 hypothetical protein [Arthrobacter gallicola]